MEYDVEKISNNIKNKKRAKKVFKYVILNILIILFIINLILSFEENIHILGIYMFNIVSESMKPTFEINDVVVVQKCTPSQLKIGDIITFEQDERIISHRIIDIIKDKDDTKFETKGDNNKIPDSEKIDAKQVYGKVLFKIQKIGKFICYIQNVRGLINIGFFVIIIFIFVSLKDKQKNERKIKRKKYEIKKMRDNYHL